MTQTNSFDKSHNVSHVNGSLISMTDNTDENSSMPGSQVLREIQQQFKDTEKSFNIDFKKRNIIRPPIIVQQRQRTIDRKTMIHLQKLQFPKPVDHFNQAFLQTARSASKSTDSNLTDFFESEQEGASCSQYRMTRTLKLATRLPDRHLTRKKAARMNQTFHGQPPCEQRVQAVKQLREMQTYRIQNASLQVKNVMPLIRLNSQSIQTPKRVQKTSVAMQAGAIESQSKTERQSPTRVVSRNDLNAFEGIELSELVPFEDPQLETTVLQQ